MKGKKSMIRFESDYQEGTHPKILEALAQTNFEQTPGYGTDRFCESAREKIRAELKADVSGIHFISGGTQTNLLGTAMCLKPWQGALSADTGHIAVHESGSVEATGHKVLTLPNTLGKISAAQILAFCREHYASLTAEHTVQPGMVYISQPTEYGTLYSLKELKDIRQACNEFGLKLFVDGARLVYALACPENDVTLSDLARLADAFYIGGTKAGALLGEALVIRDAELDRSFRYLLKQRGAMLAKGRLLGIQFDVLFTDGLYREIGSHAISQAARLRAAFAGAGYAFRVPSPTNQLFPILGENALRAFEGKYALSFWEDAPGGKVMRACTSWATRPEDVDALIRDLPEA